MADYYGQATWFCCYDPDPSSCGSGAGRSYCSQYGYTCTVNVHGCAWPNLNGRVGCRTDLPALSCGRYVTVTRIPTSNTISCYGTQVSCNRSGSIRVIVVDKGPGSCSTGCPCGRPYSSPANCYPAIDLTVAAFAAIGDLCEGKIPVKITI